MARGEGSKVDLRVPGLAIGVTFTVICLGALTCVVSTTRSCTSCTPAALFAPPPPSEPFTGAAVAAAELGWRDSIRSRQTFGGTPLADPVAARGAIEPLLRERGYVEHGGAGSLQEMPFEATLGELEGACGVALVASDGNAHLVSIGVSGGVASVAEALPMDPSLAAVGVCGAATLDVRGTGRASVVTLVMPGITPADVERGGLPADVVLAHAEAEVMLRRRGLEPADWVAREELAGTGVGAAPLYPSVPAAPGSGCTVWVAVAIGAGRSESSWGFTLLAQDHASDRALLMSASCAATAARVVLYDDPTPGATLFWRAYGGAGGGPTTPDPGATIMPTAGTLRIGSATDTVPTPLP